MKLCKFNLRGGSLFILVFVYTMLQLAVAIEHSVKLELILILISLSTLVLWPNRIQLKTVVLISLYGSLVAMFSIVNEKYKLSELLYAISGLIFAISMLNHRRMSKLAFYAGLVVFYAFLSYKYYLGIPLSEFFNSVSRNYISVLVILPLVIICLLEKNSTTIAIFIILGLPLVMFSGSRSGLVCYGFIILGMLLRYSQRRSHTLKYILFSVFIAFLIGVFIFYDFQELGSAQRLINNSGSGGRMKVLTCYAQQFDLVNLFLGPDALGHNDCAYYADGSGNPHNSYIKLYSGLGVFFIPFILFYFYRLLPLLFSRFDWMIVVYCALLARASSDWILFFTQWDVYFWLGLFLLLESRTQLNFGRKGRVQTLGGE